MLMLIVFGVRRRGRRLASVFSLCGACHAPAEQAIIVVKTSVTLFFVPVVPCGSKYGSTCTRCGALNNLTRDQAEHAVLMAEQQAAYAPGALVFDPPPPASDPRSDAPAPTPDAVLDPPATPRSERKDPRRRD